LDQSAIGGAATGVAAHSNKLAKIAKTARPKNPRDAAMPRISDSSNQMLDETEANVTLRFQRDVRGVRSNAD
jgi:hypothetical protein